MTLARRRMSFLALHSLARLQDVVGCETQPSHSKWVDICGGIGRNFVGSSRMKSPDFSWVTTFTNCKTRNSGIAKKGQKKAHRATLPGINISHQKSPLKMSFLFPRWDMLIPWRVILAASLFGVVFCSFRQIFWKLHINQPSSYT